MDRYKVVMIKLENKTNGRFYYLSLQRDLLDDLVLTITRGGARISLVRSKGFRDMALCTKEISRIIKRRLQRGYTLV